MKLHGRSVKRLEHGCRWYKIWRIEKLRQKLEIIQTVHHGCRSGGTEI